MQDQMQTLKQEIPYIVSIISALLVGVSMPDTNLENNIKNVTTEIRNSEQSFTRAEYQRLQPYMTLNKVESILGRGTEISSSINRNTYIWKNPDKSQIKATFEEGKLIEKEQFDLK